MNAINMINHIKSLKEKIDINRCVKSFSDNLAFMIKTSRNRRDLIEYPKETSHLMMKHGKHSLIHWVHGSRQGEPSGGNTGLILLKGEWEIKRIA